MTHLTDAICDEVARTARGEKPDVWARNPGREELGAAARSVARALIVDGADPAALAPQEQGLADSWGAYLKQNKLKVATVTDADGIAHPVLVAGK